MIPIKTAIPTRYPASVTWLLVATNCAVFLYQQTLSPEEFNAFIGHFALIPARLTESFTYGDTGDAAAALYPLVTMMFLHGGWLHLIFNVWTLWLFGPTIEDRLGHTRFVVFYFGCGMAASVVQVAFDPTSTIPVLGASGAIAGVLGCYVGLFPYARVIVLVPILFLPLFFALPAAIFIGLWFVFQLFQGFVDLLTASNGGSASWAHIGGFVAGILLVSLMQRPRQGYRAYYRDEGILGFGTQGQP